MTPRISSRTYTSPSGDIAMAVGPMYWPGSEPASPHAFTRWRSLSNFWTRRFPASSTKNEPSGANAIPPHASPFERTKLNSPAPLPDLPQYSTNLPSAVKIANRALNVSPTHSRPSGARTIWVGSIFPSGAVASHTRLAVTEEAGAGGANADSEGEGATALGDASGGASVTAGGGAGVKVAPSPAIAYNVPASVPSNTSPPATLSPVTPPSTS